MLLIAASQCWGRVTLYCGCEGVNFTLCGLSDCDHHYEVTECTLSDLLTRCLKSIAAITNKLTVLSMRPSASSNLF